MRKGFTLIELLVVVLIIGILAAVALPQYQKTVEKSRATQALTLGKSVAQAARVYILENNQPPTKFDDLAIDIAWTGRINTVGVSDTRSNQDWAIELLTGGLNEIYMVRLTGPYKGAGFIIPMTISTSVWTEDNIYCAEWKYGSYIFGKNPGDYCKKLFAGTLTYPAATVNIYSLP